MQDCQPAIDQARSAYDAGQYLRAASGFEAALSICPQPAALLFALGQAQLMAREFDASAATLRRLVVMEPRNLTARKTAADALYLAGKADAAEAMLKSALEIDPKHEPSVYALGRVYHQTKRYAEAVEQFKAVIVIDPKSYRAHDNIAVCYDALQEDTLALKHFFRALDLVVKDHPDYDWAHANLADFFVRRGQAEKAFQLAAEAAKRNPQSARNFFLTGKALSLLSKDELSLRWFRRAVELDPHYAQAHYQLAQALRRLGQEAEAQKHLELFKKTK